MTSTVCYVCKTEYTCDCEFENYKLQEGINHIHEKCKLRDDFNFSIIYDADSDSAGLLYPIHTRYPMHVSICSKKCHFKHMAKEDIIDLIEMENEDEGNSLSRNSDYRRYIIDVLDKMRELVEW